MDDKKRTLKTIRENPGKFDGRKLQIFLDSDYQSMKLYELEDENKIEFKNNKWWPKET
jgi:hypothetical protein